MRMLHLSSSYWLLPTRLFDCSSKSTSRAYLQRSGELVDCDIWFSYSVANLPVQRFLNYYISVTCCFSLARCLCLSPKVKTSKPSTDPSFEPSAGPSLTASNTPSKVRLGAIPHGSLKITNQFPCIYCHSQHFWSDNLIFLDGRFWLIALLSLKTV